MIQKYIRQARKQVQKGFTLVELIIAISISALLSVYAQQFIAKQSEEGLAAASGVYLAQVANATTQMVLYNWNEYSNPAVPGVPAVPGLANAYRPTVPELTTPIVVPPPQLSRPGYLNLGFPQTTTTRQNISIQVIPTACPGSSCKLDVRVCTTTPVNLGGIVRLDLASTMTTEQRGIGAQVLNIPGTGPLSGMRLTGPTTNIPVPLDPITGVAMLEGVVCSTGNVDTALYNSFVKLNDTRDPNLQGPLTVAGATNFNGPSTVNNNLTVTGTSALNGAATLGNTLSVAGASVMNSTLNVLGALTGTTAAFTGAASADSLVPLGVFASGAACPNDGAIGRKSGASGLVVCQGGSWRDLSVTAAIGDVCPVEGSSATNSAGKFMVCTNGAYRNIDSMIAGGSPGGACPTQGAFGIDTANGNASLLCRTNPAAGGAPTWSRLTDLTSNLSFVNAEGVSVDGSPVNKPNCGPSGTPLIQMIPKRFSSANAPTFNFYALDSGATWTAFMRDSSGPLLDAEVIAHTYCYYP